MEHIAALLLIVGCSNNLAKCEELPAPTAIFESMDECEGELPVGLRENVGQRPRVVARCIEVDPAMEEEDAELTWDVKPDGTLVASVAVPDAVIAAGEQAPRQDIASQQ